MAPLGSFYQLILTDQQQDDAITDLYRKNGWSLHAVALSEQVVETLLQNEDEDLVYFIQSTRDEPSYPNIQENETQPNNQPVDDTDTMNTDSYVRVKRKLYKKPLRSNRGHGMESRRVQKEKEHCEYAQLDNQAAHDDAENTNKDGYVVVKTEVCQESQSERSKPETETGNDSEIESEGYDSEATVSAEEDNYATESDTDMGTSERNMSLQENNSEKGTADLHHPNFGIHRSKRKRLNSKINYDSRVPQGFHLAAMPKTYSYKRPLKRYISVKLQKPVIKTDFQCVYCRNYYVNSKGLRQHVFHKHPDKTLPKTLPRCDLCKREFKSRDEIKAHRKGEEHRRHLMKKQTQCKQCGQYITSPETLKLHDSIPHTEKDKFPCDICGVVFHLPRMVTKHKEHLHDETNCTCDICGKTFPSMRLRQAHRVRHNEANRKHMCEHCGKSFFGTDALKTHVRTHTGEKPHKCRYCDYASACAGNLRKHEKVHYKAM